MWLIISAFGCSKKTWWANYKYNSTLLVNSGPHKQTWQTTLPLYILMTVSNMYWISKFQSPVFLSAVKISVGNNLLRAPEERCGNTVHQRPIKRLHDFLLWAETDQPLELLAAILWHRVPSGKSQGCFCILQVPYKQEHANQNIHSSCFCGQSIKKWNSSRPADSAVESIKQKAHRWALICCLLKLWFLFLFHTNTKNRSSTSFQTFVNGP